MLSKRQRPPSLTILVWTGNLGSTTLLAMALENDMPRPDWVIFPDLGWETPSTEQTIAYYTPLLAKAEIPFTRARARVPLPTQAIHASIRHISILPLWRWSGQRNAYCALEVKFSLLRQAWRRYGIPRYLITTPLQFVFGLLAGEEFRRYTNNTPRRTFLYPLLDLQITPSACQSYLEQAGYPIPPLAACAGCPFQTASQWRQVANYPDLWSQLCSLDRTLRNAFNSGPHYFSSSLQPLRLIPRLELPDDTTLGLPPGPLCWS